MLDYKILMMNNLLFSPAGKYAYSAGVNWCVKSPVHLDYLGNQAIRSGGN
jgi:hypothetical protein